MAQKIIGIDIGSSGIKIAHLDPGNKKGDGDGVRFRTEIFADNKKSLNERQEEIKQIFTRFKEAGDLTADTFVCGLSDAKTQMLRLEVPFKDEKKLAAILPGLLDSALPFDIDEIMYSWRVLHTPTDKNYALVAFTKKSNVKSLIQVLNDSGIDPKKIYLNACSGFFINNALFSSNNIFSAERGVLAAVDIGRHESTISFFTETEIVASRTIKKGSLVVEDKLSQLLDLSSEAAGDLLASGLVYQSGAAGAGETRELKIQESIEALLKTLGLSLVQTVQAVSTEFGLPLKGVMLMGGGSRISHIDQYFSELLGVPFYAFHDVKDSPKLRSLAYSNEKAAMLLKDPSSAMALGLAMGVLDKKTSNVFNFRSGEFQWRGQFNFLRGRTKPLVLWTCLVLFSLVFNYGVKSSLLSSEIQRLSKDQIDFCKKTVGPKAKSNRLCKSMMQEVISKDSGEDIPEFSAANIYLEVARVLSNKDKVKVTELDITSKTVRLRGTADKFETVDAVVANLQKGKCFANIEKGRARQEQGKINFQVNLDLDCGA